MCQALAGTGKTTVVLQAIVALQRKAVIITYNKALQLETAERARQLGVSHLVSVYTFHGVFGKQQNGTIRNNSELNAALSRHWKRGKPPQRLDVDLIFIDEVQDMCELFYQALLYILPSDAQMCVIGDVHQMLYGYRSAEERANTTYLTNARMHFEAFTKGPWVTHELSVSYRLTPNVAHFANLVWKTNIVAGNLRHNYKVQFWTASAFGRGAAKIANRIVEEVLEPHGVESLLITSQSTDKDKGLMPVINELMQKTDANGERRYNVHMKTQEDDGGTDAELLHNKMRAWTFCGSKGTESPVVLVWGFSMYDRERALSNLNQMGVALTRSSGRLIVVHVEGTNASPSDYFPGMNRHRLSDLIDRGVVEVHPDDKMPEGATVGSKMSVRSIVPSRLEALSAASLDALLAGTEWTGHTLAETRRVDMECRLTFHTGSTQTVENISSIMGVAIPFALQMRRTGRIQEVEAMLKNALPIEGAHLYGVDACKRLMQDAALPPRLTGDLLRRFYCLDSTTESVVTNIRGCDLLNLLAQEHLTDVDGLTVLACDAKHYDAFIKPYLPCIRSVYRAATRTPAMFVYLANATQAFQSVHHIWHQIGHDADRYEEWVDADGFRRALDNLDRMAPGATDFEQPVALPITPPIDKNGDRYDRFRAQVDAVTVEDGWCVVHEFKFKSETADADKVQTLVGAALIAVDFECDVTCSLHNYLHGQTLTTDLTVAKARALLEGVKREFVR